MKDKLMEKQRKQEIVERRLKRAKAHKFVDDARELMLDKGITLEQAIAITSILEYHDER